MSLSEELRRELAQIAPSADCDRLAELSGLFHSAGRLHLRGRGEVALHLDVAESAVVRRAFQLLRDVGVRSEIRTYRQRAFDGATRYQLHVEGGEGALRALHEAGILDVRNAPLERPPRRVVRRACCRRAYLRGALLGGGSLTGPRSAHLEIRATGVTGAVFLSDLARREGLRLGVLERARHAVAYAKGAEAIAGVLAAAGASDAVLVFEENAVVGATRARANRTRQRGPREPRSDGPGRTPAGTRGAGSRGRRAARHVAAAAARGGGAAAAAPVALAPRARRQVSPAGDESVAAPTPEPDRRAVRRSVASFATRVDACFDGVVIGAPFSPYLAKAGPCSSGGGFRPRPPSRSSARQTEGRDRPRSSPLGPPSSGQSALHFVRGCGRRIGRLPLRSSVSGIAAEPRCRRHVR